MRKSGSYNVRMKVFIACPAPLHSRAGNRVTAVRWQRLLRELGHCVTIAARWDGQPCDVLVAMHARKSHDAARAYRRARPVAPLIVALTGTDVYHDLPRSAAARRSVAWADRLIVLQPLAIDELPEGQRDKARVIYQSVVPSAVPPRSSDVFQICVIGHLRTVKDPLRAALALRRLPASVRCRVVQAGAALNPRWEQLARRAHEKDARYTWLGEVSHHRATNVLIRSDLMVISSRLEGGANVVSEAIVNGVPVLASRIAGNVGLLGEDYPGYFPVGDTAALAHLIERAVRDRVYYRALEAACARRRPLFEPRRERARWQALLAELPAR